MMNGPTPPAARGRAELLAAGGLYSRLYHEQFETEAAALAELGEPGTG